MPNKPELEVNPYPTDWIVKQDNRSGAIADYPTSGVLVIHLPSRLSCYCNTYASPFRNRLHAKEQIEKELQK